MIPNASGFRGRGAAENPANRFEAIHLSPDPDGDPADAAAPRTLFLRDTTSTILTHNHSPDIGFDTSLNPYRGCEHGCIYCYARPTHEYLGFSSGIDFETRIMVKENAPALLRAELSSRQWVPRPVAMSGVTDCYQPVERRLKLTRGCLEVFAEFLNPVYLITKNHLITRDIDLLRQLAEKEAVSVHISVTTLDPDLAQVMEPRASMPAARLDAIRQLAEAGIPVGVNVAPVLPGLTDHEMLSIMAAARAAGAESAGYTLLRLPHAVKDMFTAWLARHRPGHQEKVLNRMRAMRGGQLYDADFSTRMQGEGLLAGQIAAQFKVACRKHGMNLKRREVTTRHFRRPGGVQMDLL